MRMGTPTINSPVTTDPHIRLTGDPTNASPVDGDMWFDGTALNFRDASSTTDLLSAGGGALTFVSATNLSAVANSGDIAILPDRKYRVIFDFIKNTTADVQMRFNSNAGGSSYNYQQRRITLALTPVEANTGDNSSSTINIANNVRGGEHIQGDFVIDTFKKNLDSAFIHGTGTNFQNPVGDYTSFEFTAVVLVDLTITDFEILAAAGTLTGNIYLYEYQLS